MLCKTGKELRAENKRLKRKNKKLEDRIFGLGLELSVVKNPIPKNILMTRKEINKIVDNMLKDDKILKED